MNILAINNFGIKNTPAQNTEPLEFKNFMPKFGLRMAQPLSQDTVSFQATPKKLTSRANGVSLKTARIIHNEANELQPEIERFMKKIFADLTISESHPDNIVEIVKGRTKSPESIAEKSATREWNNKSEIFANMTDLNGIKIVMRDGSKKAVKKVLDRFSEVVDTGALILTEVENKRPIAAQKLKGAASEQWDYADSNDLDDFIASACESSVKPILFDQFDYTKANYPAIHFLFRFPGQKRCFEVQLMGHDVSVYKDLDDLLFKILDNKNVDNKYKPIKKIIEPLTKEGNEAILETFNKYRGEVFLFQKEKEPTSSVNKHKKEFFLPLKYDIPQELDMNNLYKLYLKCNEKKA